MTDPIRTREEDQAEIEQLSKDRYAEQQLADRLANTGHHSKVCPVRQMIGQVTLNGDIINNVTAFVVNGVDMTADVGKVTDYGCTCGWSDALKAWKERQCE